jgi:OpgC protein
LLSPLILFVVDKRKAKYLSAASIALYIYNYLQPESVPGTAQIRLTGAQFEYAFPLIAWQVLYVHAVIAGVFKEEIVEYLSRPTSRWLVGLCAVLTLAFMFFTLNHPMDRLPDWAQFSVIPHDSFLRLYEGYFLKYKLGPGRLLNEVVLFVTVYAVLTACWRPIERAVGWFFIPLGAASLYVFVVHVFLVLAVANTVIERAPSFWVDSALHAAMLLLVWACVKYRLLFRWVPH